MSPVERDLIDLDAIAPHLIDVPDSDDVPTEEPAGEDGDDRIVAEELER